jgi:hypothetical protein
MQPGLFGPGFFVVVRLMSFAWLPRITVTAKRLSLQQWLFISFTTPAWPMAPMR